MFYTYEHMNQLGEKKKTQKALQLWAPEWTVIVVGDYLQMNGWAKLE